MTTTAVHGSPTAGAATLLRFMLRRERSKLPWWLLGAGLLVCFQSLGSQRVYGTPEKLAQFRETFAANAAAVAMAGPSELLETIGGEAVFEVSSYVAVVVALMSMFLVGRHTRADEEAGRAELIRSTQVGRRAILLATLALAGLANLAVAVVVFAAGAGTGLPVAGSLLFGAAMAGVGVSFAALTAIAVQVFENPRAVYGAVGVALGVSYVLRAAGDVGDGMLSWLSPIGWAQRTLPYVQDRWWPLLLPVGVAALLVPIAFAVLDRRDFGAGLIPPRPGPATASRALGSPLALAWRLQRASLVGWAVGVILLSTAFGSLGHSVEQLITDNPEIADVLPGGGADVVNSYLALAIVFVALVAAAYGVASAMRARNEEVSGRAEPILATPTSRWAWLGSHLAVALPGTALLLAAAGFGEGLAYGLVVADPTQIPRLTGVALVYVPAVWLIVAVVVLGYGWVPRAAAALGWGFVALCAGITLFADVVDLPEWLRNASPFTHTPQAPLEAVTATPLVAIAAIAVVLLAGGFVGFRRRDVG